MIHGGGEGRRLPAYAPAGKLFIPMPVWRWATGQRIDQNLLELQLPYLERIISHAPQTSRLLVASGDVLVKFDDRLPQFPPADVICVGLWGKPEDARHFGVFFCSRHNPGQLAFFRQKPSVAEIQRLATDNLFLLDAGIWMLSERAIDVLLALGACNTTAGCDESPAPTPFELYSDFGLGLGKNPSRSHSDLNSLSTAVVPLDNAEFYHFGRSSDLIESSLRLQNLVLNQHTQRSIGVKRHPDLFTQNACIDLQWNNDNHRIWVENTHIGVNWRLTTDHILTGIPRNDWAIHLPPGMCLDIVPLDAGDKLAIRFYGINDDFRGPIGDRSTLWMGTAALGWFDLRRLALAAIGIDARSDIQHARLFPVLSRADIRSEFLQWLVDHSPVSPGCQGTTFADAYARGERISAHDMGSRVNLDVLHRQRRGFLAECAAVMAQNPSSVFYHTDLKHMANVYNRDDRLKLPPPLAETENDLMVVVHDRMFRAETLRRQNRDDSWKRWEDEAFALLRRAVLEPVRSRKVQPRCDAALDQIVWARSPVRLDLAGGWTDTPPYCQLHGGSVANLAVTLNGQPPLQAFVRRCGTPHILLRSIDLGSETRLVSYNQIADCGVVGNEFSIAKAALAVAGFHPDFNGRAFSSLEAQLYDFGGGIEMSFVAAVPKGSGLGTSSILAATILGALGEFCSLKWNVSDACSRTLALEQMLTSGGGWQDQFGAALHGCKLLETDPGIIQSPRVKWLPEHMIAEAIDHGLILLYYTGITRIAKNILQDIVRGMFLNHRSHLAVLGELGRHAQQTYETIQAADWDGLCEAIGHSWELNQRIDSGTNPPEIQQILKRIGDWSAGAKLLGAGGGGYLMICAKTPDAAHAIRHELTHNPPNSRARFVTPAISPVGLEITRS